MGRAGICQRTARSIGGREVVITETTGDEEKLVCMATDAMRLCLGIPPRNFTPREIARFITRRARDVGTN